MLACLICEERMTSINVKITATGPGETSSEFATKIYHAYSPNDCVYDKGDCLLHTYKKMPAVYNFNHVGLEAQSENSNPTGGKWRREGREGPGGREPRA